MIARFLLLVFALAVSGGLGQVGLYGPVAKRVKAGDVAPDITFTRVVSSPVAGSWSQTNLSGQLTVLAFFPDTSHNLEMVTLWNEVVEQFDGEPVQFLWITGEEDSTLVPWLNEHPVRGWVFQDLGGKTGNAYGMEIPANVIVGADRKIVGFYNAIAETGYLLEAAQDGRITTTRPDKETTKAFVESGKVFIDAEPWRMPRVDDYKPAFPPSYTVHVSLSKGEQRGSSNGADFRALKGYTLKETISTLYDVNPIRVDLPASLDNNQHYDFALVLPGPESREKMTDRMRQGLQNYFHVTARRENRLVDVYVVSDVPDRKPPAGEVRTGEEIGGRSAGIELALESSQKPVSIGAVRSVSTDGTVDEFCQWLEASLDRPVVNETNLEGEFKFHLEGSDGPENDFLDRLRDQLGLVITPAQRNVETLVFEPR